MATEKVIEIKVLSEQAQKNISDINGVIDEQRAILVLLEEEYLKAKKALDDYNASNSTNLAQEKSLKKTLKERKDALQDQRLGLKKLAIQQREANREAQQFRKNQKETTNVIRGIDKLTGGFATKVVKLGKGFKSGVGGIKSFIVGLSGVKKALIATGLGALVVLVGTLIANFDKIKTLLTGISKESQNAAEFAKESADASKQQLDNLEASNNILKLQGKTEKEIRDLKKQQTDETILALEASLEAQKTIRDLQEEAEKRNQKILLGIINFITTPIRTILKVIDEAGKKFGKDFGLAAQAMEADKMIAKSIFSGIDEEGTKAIEDTEKLLLQLRNKRAGFALKDREDFEKKREQDEQDFFNEMFAEEAREDMRRESRIAKQQEEDAFFKEMFDAEEQEDIARNKRILESEQQTQARITAAKAQAVNAAISLFGAESAAGKAALIAKQLLGAQEMIAEAKKTITFSSLVAARSQAAVAEGTAQTAKVGFPQNIPLLIGYALQAVGIVSAITSAVSKTKSVASSLGGGGGGGASISTPSAPASQPPSFNIVGASDTNQLADAIGGQTQQPVQAFVVANDVTTAQSLENNIVEGATL
tara:strand:- start:13 stop:1794 length:1782 start_codon:yes stop_codon:yes gene_type:complete